MKNCITLIDKLVEFEKIDCWRSAKEFQMVLGSTEFKSFWLDGNYLKGKQICYPDVDCRDVGWAILHSCEEYGQLDAVMEVQPHNWTQNGSEFLLKPCFKIAETPAPKKKDSQQGYTDLLKTKPCELLEFLLNCSIDLAKPGTKTSRSGFGRSYTYGKGDKQLLNQHIQMARSYCAQCNPCHPCVKGHRRSISISVC